MKKINTKALRIKSILEEMQEGIRIQERLKPKARDLTLRLKNIKQKKIKVCLALNQEHHRRLKIASLNYGYSMSTLVQTFIDMYCP